MSPGVEFNIKKPIKRKLLSMYFVRGWWTDKDNQPIKEAGIGDTIRFHIETEHVDDGDEIVFEVYDSDGAEFVDDKLSLAIQGTTSDYNKVKITGNKGLIEWTTGEGSRALLQESFEGDELELYVKCEYKGNTVSLPHDSDDYLLLYEKEVLITVLIELPHSKYSIFKKGQFFSAIGLAGHSAMAVGDRYFDYGPDNIAGTYSEKEYDVDFNNDGDKEDDVYLDSPSFMNAPGRPWWGEKVALKLAINPSEVKLKQVIDYINLKWQLTGIYGEVHKIEFYVKESESKKMLKWWEERYEHLKIYSVWPWIGEQCTTAVKTAIQQAFPFDISKAIGSNYITDTTQTPEGLLEEIRQFISTSKQHSKELAKEEIIKKESQDFKPK